MLMQWLALDDSRMHCEWPQELAPCLDVVNDYVNELEEISARAYGRLRKYHVACGLVAAQVNSRHRDQSKSKPTNIP